MTAARSAKRRDYKNLNTKARQGHTALKHLHLQRLRGQRPAERGRAQAAAGAGSPGPRSPEELEGALVDLPALLQAPPRVLLLPPAQHELLVGPVALRAIVVGRGLQHGRADFHLQRGGAAVAAERQWLRPVSAPGGRPCGERARQQPLTHLLHVELLQGGHLQAAGHGGSAALLELPSAPAAAAQARPRPAARAHARRQREAVSMAPARTGVAMGTPPRSHGGGGRPLPRGHRARQVGSAGCGGHGGCPPSIPVPKRLVSSRMEGQGTYRLPTGTEYRGALKDGMFDGEGELLFPNGGRYRAVWRRGVPMQVSWAGGP